MSSVTIHNGKKATPFLKWAGGKRWIVRIDALPIPESYNTYIEPFLGAGAVFLQLRPNRAIISDLNSELIEAYRVIRDKPCELIAALEVHQRLHNKRHYYATRSNVPDSKLGRAARFLYLNRTCWNGLYRVNKKGEFNVPIGTKTAVVLDSDEFVDLSKVLKRVSIKSCDFQSTISLAGSGDFLFVDPPYTANHNENGFLKYNEKIFSWADQIRLRDALLEAKERGARIVVCNADHESIRDEFVEVGKYIQVARHSVLSGAASGRKPTTEALFVSWD